MMKMLACCGIVALGGVLVGCGGEDESRASGATAPTSAGPLSAGGTESGGATDSGDTDDATSAANDDDDGAASDTLVLDVAAGETGIPESEEEECAAFSEEAENELRPADIIFVVDNSGSMGDEAAAVQLNLNNFSQQIIASGVDARVTLISSYPNDGNGICVDPPLGAGGCPGADTNVPLFNHINDRIGSNDALQRLLAHAPTWMPTIRPDSSLHLVIVTDDESNLDALSFDAQFKALNPDFVDYKLHGIVSMMNCADAAEIGQVYIALGQLTMGLLSDLCLQNFQPVFDLLATEVISGSVLTCEWAVPQPPEGEDFDPDKVNVEFDDGSGNLLTIGRVDSAADCPNVVDGWYYDNPANPTMILACPATCEKMQGAMMASINITLGCATIPAAQG